MTCKTIIDQIQERLHDDGVLWSRDELLDWLNDGYRQLLAQSHACVRPVVFDVPPRVAWAGTQEWEDSSAKGTFQRFTRAGVQQLASTHDWEMEHLDGITPTSADTFAVSNLWERAYTDSDLNRRFRFAIGKEHERPLRVYWDDRQLAGVSSRELDLRDTSWWNQSGEPIMWLKGSGRDKSFEVFEIQTDYNQQYELRDAEHGVPRYFSGERTYGVQSGLYDWGQGYTSTADTGIALGLAVRFTTPSSTVSGLYLTHSWEDAISSSNEANAFTGTFGWESSFGADEAQVGIGNARSIVSTDRHYLAAPVDGSSNTPVGGVRDIKSSASSVVLWEVVVNVRQLTEDDAPVLVPTQLYKYLRFYVLGRAFARIGEGQRPDLAQHYSSLFQAGVTILTALGNPTMIDRVFAREDYAPPEAGRPPRVRLPSTFPRNL